MPRSKEREEARIKLIAAAALYLDAGALLSAALVEPLADGMRLEIDFRIIRDEPLVEETPVVTPPLD